MAIVPDTKDWTWVLHSPCPECGFTAADVDPASVPDRLRANAAEWNTVLTTRDDVHVRPEPSVWSPLEYGCHVRDVCRIFDARLVLMLSEDDPMFTNWDQDVTAVEERYAEQDPVTVASELVNDAAVLAARFEGVRGAQWQRTGNRSDGAHFTVESFSRYFLHDVVHHLHDVGA